MHIVHNISSLHIKKAETYYIWIFVPIVNNLMLSQFITFHIVATRWFIFLIWWLLSNGECFIVATSVCFRLEMRSNGLFWNIFLKVPREILKKIFFRMLIKFSEGIFDIHWNLMTIRRKHVSLVGRIFPRIFSLRHLSNIRWLSNMLALYN